MKQLSSIFRTGRVSRPIDQNQIYDKTVLLSYLSFLVFLLFLTYFPGDQIAILNNDQLDSFLPYFQALPGTFESLLQINKPVEGHLSGITLNSVGFSELSLWRIIATIFPDYLEFSVFFLVYLSALFVSSYLLISALLQEFAKIEINRDGHVAIGIAAFFITALPHSAVVLDALISLNFYIYATLRVLKRRENLRKNMGLFAVAGLFSNFILGGYFFIPATLVLVGILSFRAKTFATVMPQALLGTLIVILFDYRTFLGLVAPGEISHRANWLDGLSYSFSALISPSEWWAALKLPREVINGSTPHYHYQWNTDWILFKSLGLLGLIVAALKVGDVVSRQEYGETWFTARDKRLFLTASIFIVSIIIVLLGYGILRSGLLDLRVILNQPAQFERVIVVLPLLGGGLLATTLILVFDSVKLLGKGKSWIMIGLIVGGLTWVSLHTPFQRRMENNKHYLIAGRGNPFIPKYTTGSKYSKSLYAGTKDALGEGWKDEVTLTIGGDAMATAYNRFKTLDGYFPNYPERYQQEFLEIIKPSFDQLPDRTVKRYTGWGNRLNVPIIKRNPDNTLVTLINGCEFQKLGGTLVLAFSPIEKPELSQLLAAGSNVAQDPKVRGTIHLYRPNSEACDKRADGLSQQLTRG